MTKRLMTAIAAALLLIAPAACATDKSSTQPATCTEDMDCWDCNTMGNQICGEAR